MKNALIVIDVQNIYTNKESELYVKNNSKVVNNINLLIEKFRKNKQLIIFVKHQHIGVKDSGRMFDYTGKKEDIQFLKGKPETEFDSRLKIEDNDLIVTKTRYDAFINTNLQQLLVLNKIKKVTICGFMTNYCCESTARTAHDNDYYVDFVVDATGTPSTETLSANAIIKATANTLANGFAVIKNTIEC